MLLIIFVGFRLFFFLLVGGLEDVLFFHVLRIVIPIASYFSDGVAQPPTSLWSSRECSAALLLEIPQAVALGGRAAEELFVGKISTGASDDLDKAAMGGSFHGQHRPAGNVREPH